MHTFTVRCANHDQPASRSIKLTFTFAAPDRSAALVELQHKVTGRGMRIVSLRDGVL